MKLLNKQKNEILQTTMSQLNNRKKHQIAEETSESIKKPNVSITNSNHKIGLRVLSRVVVIFSLLIVVYFSSKGENEKPFAKQSEVVVGKGQIIECSEDYLKEIYKYDECYPKQCKRYVTDQVISVKEANELLNIAKKGFTFGGSDGGASILDLHSGALSKGQHFISIYSLEAAKDVFTPSNKDIVKMVEFKIKQALAHHFSVNPNKLYLTSPSFFSKITSKRAVTLHDEYWHPHVDKETYKSFHYTTLLYLGDYGTDFEGGRFIFIDKKQNRTIEPKKARLSMFTSGSENLHYVEKVKSGVRYALTVAFTCEKDYTIEEIN